AVPSLIIIFLFLGSGDDLNLGKSLFDYYRNFYFDGLFFRIRSFFVLDNYFLYDKHFGELIALVFFLFVIGFIFWGIVVRGDNKSNGLQKHVKIPLNLALSCSLFCYLFLPVNIPIHTHMQQRFSVLSLLSMIIIASRIVPRKMPRGAYFLMCLVCFLHFGLWAQCFKDFEQRNKSFTKELFPDPSTGGRLVGLIYDYSFRRFASYIHFPNYYIVWRQGIAATVITQCHFGALRLKQNGGYLPYYYEWVGINGTFNPDYLDMDYLLVRGQMPASHRKHLKDDFIVSKREGAWSLYKKLDKKDSEDKPS
ncbi:MAG: hypothetical protein JW734_07840, partial [Candidatus Omnitrophica bacterium]|nr:hypothetical protein [Candidatus Omnitrophota bacterium]